MEYLLKSLELNEALGDKVRIARNYGNIGSVYFYYNRLDDALKYLTYCLSLNESVGDKVRIVDIYFNIARTYLAKGMKDEAKKNAENVLIRAREFEKETGIIHSSTILIKELLDKLK